MCVCVVLNKLKVLFSQVWVNYFLCVLFTIVWVTHDDVKPGVNVAFKRINCKELINELKPSFILTCQMF